MKTPIVFVHGNTMNGKCWEPIAKYFIERGYTSDDLWALTFHDPVGEPHDAMSEQIDEYVRRVRETTGAKTVHMIGHSLGASGIRYWLEDRDRYDWADTVIYMAGALHGTDMCKFRAFTDENFSEPCDTISIDAMNDEDNLLAQLNERDGECPDGVTHYTIRALYDKYFVTRPMSPTLDGAVENKAILSTHKGLLNDTTVKKLLYEWLS